MQLASEFEHLRISAAFSAHTIRPSLESLSLQRLRLRTITFIQQDGHQSRWIRLYKPVGYLQSLKDAQKTCRRSIIFHLRLSGSLLLSFFEISSDLKTTDGQSGMPRAARC